MPETAESCLSGLEGSGGLSSEGFGQEATEREQGQDDVHAGDHRAQANGGHRVGGTVEVRIPFPANETKIAKECPRLDVTIEDHHIRMCLRQRGCPKHSTSIDSHKIPTPNSHTVTARSLSMDQTILEASGQGDPFLWAEAVDKHHAFK